MTVKYILLWIVFISLISIIVTVHDKKSAIKHLRRVPEKTLLLLGFLGGATAMYITMKLIRHKTLHLKFMLSLPAFILLHILITAAGYYYGILHL